MHFGLVLRQAESPGFFFHLNNPKFGAGVLQAKRPHLALGPSALASGGCELV